MARLVVLIPVLALFSPLLSLPSTSDCLASPNVEYVIITNESLAPEFQRLADWKIENGIQAEVRTVEWIEANYPAGVDPAEKRSWIRPSSSMNGSTCRIFLPSACSAR